jgi:hypothetical protein
MMHGREKSDSAIVAVKPTNKAVPTAAEPVEPRAGAKGNARQQSTHRTQGRERVAQALERVRQAARQRKKERLTPPPYQHRLPADGVLRAQTRCRLRGGWTDVADLRSRP